MKFSVFMNLCSFPGMFQDEASVSVGARAAVMAAPKAVREAMEALLGARDDEEAAEAGETLQEIEAASDVE